MSRNLTYEEARQYTIKSILDFLEGTGGQWDWDDFTSIPLGFSDLETIQNFCANLSVTHPPVGYCSEDGLKAMREKVDDLVRNATK